MATTEHNPKINYISCDGCAERDKLRDALRPFAEAFNEADSLLPVCFKCGYGWWRDAAALLERKENSDEKETG